MQQDLAGKYGLTVWKLPNLRIFNKSADLEANPVSVELTYGIERLASYIQDKENVFDLEWTEGFTYRDIFLPAGI